MQLPAWRELAAILRPVVQGASYDELPDLYAATRAEYGEQLGRAALGACDRFFLLTHVLHRLDAVDPWIFARCREVEANPDGYLDLWAREHYKSTLITFAGSIQEVINDPEITIGIFSHTKPIAKKFFTLIKDELEGNEDLRALYPEIFWARPKLQSPRWSDEKGIVVKRKSNPRESTWEAHGLVDGQPTSAHFKLRIYDDVVTLESVTTPEMVAKTTVAHSISSNLGARGEDGMSRAWHAGTRYKWGDTYQQLIERKALKPRIYPATDNGLPNGHPVLLTPAAWAKARVDQISSVLAAQMLMNPAAGLEAMFQRTWLNNCFHYIRPGTLNVYIMCDPASSRKRNSDNTALLVVGIDAGRNKWLLGGYCHKMGLTERWQKIRDLHKHWGATPGVQIVRVGYERFGLRDALDHFEERMEIERLGFEIIELAWPREGGNAKYDRIQRLEPDFRAGKWHFAAVAPIDPRTTEPIPETKDQIAVREAGQAYRVFRPAHHKDHEGNIYALHKRLFDEYVAYPYVTHDDSLDCLSRIYDMDPAPPILIDASALEPEVFADGA